MLSILGRSVRLCDGVPRREVLRIGGLAFPGLMWSDWLRNKAAAASTGTSQPASGSFGKARSCILIYNYGGPSHLDTLDLKPDAPVEIRGEFQPVHTRVIGISISEHLPKLATIADRYSIIRSAGHRDNDHAIGAYLALTGYSHPKNAILGIEPPASPQDLPSMGSVVSKLRSADASMFTYVTLGVLRHLGNHDSMGQNGGCLGKAYDPFTVPFVIHTSAELDLKLVKSILENCEAGRLNRRRQFLQQIQSAAPQVEAAADVSAVDSFSQRAFELLSSPASRNAFDLSQEPQQIRDVYGPTPFARNCLLARRLVEAGVPLITLYSVGNREWDTHSDNFSILKNTLLPDADHAVSTLLQDLDERGHLDETLVVWMSEMGRTPMINNNAGRDHWSLCYSLIMAGGGIRPGQVYGSSDRSAAYPATNLVSPADLSATIYHCLGIEPQRHVYDQQGRPIVVSTGEPMQALL